MLRPVISPTDRSSAPVSAANVPGSAEFRDEAAARAQVHGDPRGDRVGVHDPVQRRVREDRIEAGFERERARVGHDQRQPRMGVAGALDHLSRCIEPDGLGARIGNRAREVPRPAADIQDALAGLRLEQRHQFATVLVHEGMTRVVQRRVPSLSHLGQFGSKRNAALRGARQGTTWSASLRAAVAEGPRPRSISWSMIERGSERSVWKSPRCGSKEIQ